MQSLKKEKKIEETKEKCEITDTELYYLIKYFLLCYGSSEGTTYIVSYIYLYVKKTLKRRGTILLAYSTILEKPKSSLFSTLAIFDMTTELFSSTVCSVFHRSVDWTINRSPFQKSLLILAKTNKSRSKKKKKYNIEENLPLPSILHRHARHPQSFMYSSEQLRERRQWLRWWADIENISRRLHRTSFAPASKINWAGFNLQPTSLAFNRLPSSAGVLLLDACAPFTFRAVFLFVFFAWRMQSSLQAESAVSEREGVKWRPRSRGM